MGDIGARKLNHLKALIIVHGKSEYQICQYLKQNLRIKMEIHGDKNGEKSIQITSLMNTLKDTNHKNFNAFYNKYPTIKVEGKGKNRIIEDFRIFIIMDLDDCSKEQSEAFKNKSMFKDYWAYDYITPIYNDKNLEEMLIECGIKYNKEDKRGKKQYVSIFPTDKKYLKSDTIQVKEFAEKIKNSKKSNLIEVISYLLPD